ncbi:PREDICTED: probable G-protein coupled receptor 142, partial [Myotis davidii]|uniref:probable G-protein coupled receptor 142 n=1 Tax=Myotis davidii TaxID=225400 RepID=UPI0007673191
LPPFLAAQPRVAMLPTPNGSGPSPEFEGHWPKASERSPCVAGVIPTIYYSILLSLGLPVNLLTTVALARLAARTRKPVYYYLLALTASDIVTQVVIVFVGFLLQGAVLARDLPRSVAHTVNILEFAAIHASVWIAVLLTFDRYSALCHPLHHRAASSPGRARRDISIVLGAALLTGIPFYWWLDVWRDPGPPSTLDEALKQQGALQDGQMDREPALWEDPSYCKETLPWGPRPAASEEQPGGRAQLFPLSPSSTRSHEAASICQAAAAVCRSCWRLERFPSERGTV